MATASGTVLTGQLRGLPPAKAAQKAVSEIAKDKVIAREQKAENAWRGLLATVEKQPKEKRGGVMKVAILGFI